MAKKARWNLPLFGFRTHNREKSELRTAKASGSVSPKARSKEYSLNNENPVSEMHQYAQRMSVALTKELAKNNLGERILKDISAFGKNELFPPELEEITTQMAFRTLTSGERPKTLAKELIAAFPELEYKSVCAALQTKCAIASAAKGKYRALDLGLNWYIWRTARDGDRVRKHHQFMEGVICNWNDPPNPERLLDGSQGKCVHPGYDTECRCIALNVVDLEDIEFPAKVHVMGVIKTVTSLRKMQKLDKQNKLQR